jgi:hypothetical protein
VFPPALVPRELGEAETWARFARLRDRVERDSDALVEVRAVLAPIEAELWADADDASAEPVRRAEFVADVWARVESSLVKLGV